VLPVGPVRVYVCGITPYAVTHLGHASTFVWTDLAARVLRGAGHQVQLARNVTDVDEALFAAALRQGRPYDELAALARFSFDRTMTALRVRVPEHEPVARRQVDRVVQLATAGRPGWHAECATMVLSTFGPGVDLHAGGADLRYPHHAVEAPLAERAIGVTPFARAWLHPGGGQGGRGEDGEIHGDPRGPAAGVGAVDAAPRPGTSSRCSAWADPLRVQVPPT